MPALAKTTFQFFWRDRSVPGCFRTGVSLHSHTMYSEESLDMVPRYTAKVPYLSSAIRRQEAMYSARRGRSFDFANAFWTPPLAPRQAYRLEEKQIARQFRLPALVSLTDHDNIQAGMLLRVMDRFRRAPVSTEWTIHFGGTFFHLGLHNLPPDDAPAIMRDLAVFTACPGRPRLGELLERLNSYESVLVVLNHPLWDEKGIGQASHEARLLELLRDYQPYFHALELNGLRSWAENQGVVALGCARNLPVISGGDRHGREPNAILNLSAAGNLPEFVEEVRRERKSHVVFMPQYHEPLKFRVLQTMVDVVREYPENVAGRRNWIDRVFYRDPATNAVVPLAAIWSDGGPAIVKQFLSAMRLLEWRGVRSAMRILLNDRATVRAVDQEAVF